MYDIDYVKTHLDEFEEDVVLKNFTRHFVSNFIPVEQYGDYGLRYTGKEEPIILEWTEENIINLLVDMTKSGYEAAKLIANEPKFSSCENLMVKVVNSWCKVLQNGIELNSNNECSDIQKFLIIAEHYGFKF